MYELIALPSTATILEDVGTTSKPVFTELLPIGTLLVGFVVGALIVVAIIAGIRGAFDSMIDRLHGHTSKFDH